MFPSSMRMLWECWPYQLFLGLSRIGKEVWKLFPSSICLSVWLEWNQRIFEGVSASSSEMVDLVISKLYHCLSCRGLGVPMGFQE